MTWGMIGGAAVSVVGGALMSDGSGGGSTQTTSTEPWEPTQEWLKDNIKQGQELQGHYQQNPWNVLQQNGYQNLYGDIDNFRGSIAPRLMNYANGLMNTNYQRQAAGTELGAANPYSSNIAGRQSRGLLSSQPSSPANMQFSTQPLSMSGQGGQSAQGLLGPARAGTDGAMASGNGWSNGATPMPKGGLTSNQPGAAELLNNWLSQAGQSGGGQGGGWSGMDGVAASSNGLLPTAGAQQASGPFTMTPNARGYGTLDFTALNPWTSTLKPEEKPAEAEPDKQTVEQMIEEWMKTNDPGYIQRREINKWGDGGA